MREAASLWCTVAHCFSIFYSFFAFVYMLPRFFTTGRSAASLMRRIACTFTLVLAFTLWQAPAATAQSAPGSLGIGGQIGSPSGVTLKIDNPGDLSYDFLAAWDLGDFFFLNAHGLFQERLRIENEQVGLFYGPGGYIGFRERNGRDDDVVLGISGTVGLNVFVEQFEFYAQLTPRLDVIPSTDGRFGGGVGVRYYFN